MNETNAGVAGVAAPEQNVSPLVPSQARQRFLGTDSARHLRAIDALMRGPVPRVELDRIVGCTNSPQVVAQLRARGLEVPCERIEVVDRDGKLAHVGRYQLTSSDREKLGLWLASKEMRS